MAQHAKWGAVSGIPCLEAAPFYDTRGCKRQALCMCTKDRKPEGVRSKLYGPRALPRQRGDPL